jgi:hypothetical protein
MRRLRLEAILRLKHTYITVTLHEVAAAIEDGDIKPEALQAAERDLQQLVRRVGSSDMSKAARSRS